MSETFSPEKASILRSPESVGRARDYFDLQLSFAEAVAEKTGEGIGKALFKYTNLYRRFGLGSPKNAPAAAWISMDKALSTLNTHQERLECVLAYFARMHYEKDDPPERQFGCFTFEPDSTGEMIHIHFRNGDPHGPLSRERQTERKEELRSMFSYIKEHFPNAKLVEGQSWLYGLEAYRRLFPPSYVSSREANMRSKMIQGTSRWGQFLDHQGRVKQDLKQEFLHNLSNLDPDNLAAVFPMKTYHVVAPIEDFYKHFTI